MSPTLHVAAMLLAAGASSPTNDARPLRLQIDRDGDATIIQVVGAAGTQTSASYDLEVGSAGNRSVHKGVAHLQPGIRAIVATVRLGGQAHVSARLTVYPSSISAYHEEADIGPR